MIIDSHTHVEEVGDKQMLPEQLIASMDEAGIDYSLLFANAHTGRGVSTQRIVEISKQYPRLKAVGNITYSSFGAEQFETIKGYIKNKEIVG